jgi:hypothetical protein
MTGLDRPSGSPEGPTDDTNIVVQESHHPRPNPKQAELQKLLQALFPEPTLLKVFAKEFGESTLANSVNWFGSLEEVVHSMATQLIANGQITEELRRALIKKKDRRAVEIERVFRGGDFNDRAELRFEAPTVAGETASSKILIIGSMNHLELEPKRLHASNHQPLTRLAWSHDGSCLAAPSLDGRVTIWNTRSHERVKTLNLGSDIISTAIWVDIHKSRMLVTASGHEVTVWAEEGDWEQRLHFPFDGTVHDLEWTPQAELFVAAGAYIRRCEVEPHKSTSRIAHGTPQGELLSVTADGKYMATADSSGTLRVYRRNGTGHCWDLIPVEVPSHAKVKDVAWSRGIQPPILATPCRDGALRLYGVDDGRCALRQTIPETERATARTAAFSSSGEWLASESSNGVIKVLRRRGELFHLEDCFPVSNRGSGRPYRIAFSPTEDRLAWAATDEAGTGMIVVLSELLPTTQR